MSIGEDAWILGDSIDEALARIAVVDQPWIGVFVGHPTRFRYRTFWDAGYASGQTPNAPVYAEATDDVEYERGKDRLRSFLVAARDRFEIVGVEALLSRMPAFRPATERERAWFNFRTAENLRAAKAWPIHRPNLNVEGIVAKAIDAQRTVELAVWSNHVGADIS